MGDPDGPHAMDATGPTARVFVLFRQVSWLAALALLPRLPDHMASDVWGRLAAYSCGGSAGMDRLPFSSLSRSRVGDT